MTTPGPDALRWRCSSFCNAGACVEVAFEGGVVAMRNSGNPGDWLTFSAASWRNFVDRVKNDSLGCDS